MAINAFTSLENNRQAGTNSQAEIRQALTAASRATGVDFAYLVAEASVESSLDPKAKAKTSSAAGLFQFIESTWEGMIERHGAKVGLAKEAAALESGDVSAAERRRIMDMRYDPKIAARMGAEFAAENRDHLQSRLGREPDDADLYLAHFLGPGGASKFLQRHTATPDAAAADSFPAAARANQNIFYAGDRARSYEEIRDRFSAKLAARADDLDKLAPANDTVAPATNSPIRITYAARSSAGFTPHQVAAPETPRTETPQTRGDPWLTTLITAQLSMTGSLLRDSSEAAPETGETFRSLMG